MCDLMTLSSRLFVQNCLSEKKRRNEEKGKKQKRNKDRRTHAHRSRLERDKQSNQRQPAGLYIQRVYIYQKYKHNLTSSIEELKFWKPRTTDLCVV